MITLDTSGLLAYINAADQDHAACTEVMGADPGPWIVPAVTLAEVTWLLETRFPPQVELGFLDDVLRGAYTLTWESSDLAPIRQLIERYTDLGLGFADAAVIVCARRNGGRVLTLDYRHFPVVAREEKSLSILPLPA